MNSFCKGIFTFFLLFFIKEYFFCNLYSLDFHETLNAKVNFVDNLRFAFIIEKGEEDGIVVGDVIKLLTENETIGNAACIVTSPNYSEWIIFKAYHFKKLQKNNTIQLIGLYSDEKPTINNIQYHQQNSELNKRKKEYYSELYINSKKALEEKQDILFKQYKLARYHTLSIPPTKATLSVSPLNIEWPYYEKNWKLGLSLENLNNNIHEANIQLDHDLKHYKTSLKGNLYQRQNTSLSINYINHQILDKPFYYKSTSSFSKEKDGPIWPKLYEINLGPLGIGYSWNSLNKRESFFLETVLQYEIFQTSVINRDGTLLFSNNYLRQLIKTSYSTLIGDNLNIKELIVIRPRFDSLKDMDLKNQLSLQVTVSQSFLLSMDYIYSWDLRRKTVNHLPSTRQEISANISYGLNIGESEKK